MADTNRNNRTELPLRKNAFVAHLEEIKQAVLGRISGDDEVEFGEIHAFLLNGMGRREQKK